MSVEHVHEEVDEILDLPVPEHPRRAALVAAGVVLLVGILFLVLSILLDVGTFARPGAGMFPAIIAGILVLTSLVLLARDRGLDVEAWTPLSRRSLVGAALGVVFIVLFAFLGLFPPALIVVILWLRFEGKSWRMSLLTGVISAVCAHVLFIEVLGVYVRQDVISMLWRG